VIDQAVILSVLGYLPGFSAALLIYHAAVKSTGVPMLMTWERALTVLVLSLLMSVASALLALRKVRQADPAEVF